MDEQEVARLAAVEAARIDAVRTRGSQSRSGNGRTRARVAAIETACKPFTALSVEFRAELISSGSTVEAAGSKILNKLAWS